MKTGAKKAEAIGLLMYRLRTLPYAYSDTQPGTYIERHSRSDGTCDICKLPSLLLRPRSKMTQVMGKLAEPAAPMERLFRSTIFSVRMKVGIQRNRDRHIDFSHTAKSVMGHPVESPVICFSESPPVGTQAHRRLGVTWSVSQCRLNHWHTRSAVARMTQADKEQAISSRTTQSLVNTPSVNKRKKIQWTHPELNRTPLAC
ncbi:hypothetical protein H4582DRAFT_1921968 [Lactarius indigo]|nr:hypothetical protein H4582DRAFT_1921968 [Lactarius indigo]